MKLSLFACLLATSNAFITPVELSKRQYSTQIYNASQLEFAIKKMRGASISIEYNRSKDYSQTDVLSMQLRRAKAAAIFVRNFDQLEGFLKEQESARGNFPGPCPIVYNGPFDELDVTKIEGLSGVVVDVGLEMDGEIVQKLKDEDVMLIKRISGVGQIKPAEGEDHYQAYEITVQKSVEELTEILETLPQGSLVITDVEAMQHDNIEIGKGKEIAALKPGNNGGAKVTSLLICNACVGDEEDVKYTNFVVDAMNKKSSSQFKMMGLTGSTNGHFGTFEYVVGETFWNRVKHT